MGYKIINLKDIYNTIGEDKTKEILSSYKCDLNTDVEYFLKEKAIEFSKQDISRTFLVLSTYKNENVIVGYFAIANKATVVKTYNQLYNEFGEHIENGVRHTKTIYDEVNLIKTRENLWKSKQIGVEQTSTIELSDYEISKITNNNGCYIMINGSCHANEAGTMNVEVYEIYLTNN